MDEVLGPFVERELKRAVRELDLYRRQQLADDPALRRPPPNGTRR